MYSSAFQAQLRGILVHENFHIQGVRDENFADHLTIKALHQEYGREGALSYIEFVENHSPGVVRNCLLTLVGQSEHLSASQRGEELRRYVDNLERGHDFSDRIRNASTKIMSREHIRRIHGTEVEDRDGKEPERESSFRRELPRVRVHR